MFFKKKRNNASIMSTAVASEPIKIPKAEDKFELNFHSKNHKNANVLIFGAPGAGKTTLFQKILAEEHEQLGKNIRSIIFNSDYEYRDNDDLVEVELSDFKLNPFEIYSKSNELYLHDTVKLVNTMLKSAADDLKIRWTQEHYFYLKELLRQVLELKQPSLKHLQELALDKLSLPKSIVELMVEGRRMKNQIADELILKKSEFSTVLGNYKYAYDINLCTSYFIDEKSPWGNFLSHTDIPDEVRTNCSRLVINTANYKESNLSSVVALVTMYLKERHVEEKNTVKLSVYHDSNECKFGVSESIIYCELMETYLKISRTQEVGLRISTSGTPQLCTPILQHFDTIIIGYSDEDLIIQMLAKLDASNKNLQRIVRNFSPHEFFFLKWLCIASYTERNLKVIDVPYSLLKD